MPQYTLKKKAIFSEENFGALFDGRKLAGFIISSETKAFLLEEMSGQAFDFSLKNGWPGIAAGRAHYIFR